MENSDPEWIYMKGLYRGYESGQLSIINQCVEVDFLKFPAWRAKLYPGTTKTETAEDKGVVNDLLRFIQSEIKKQEGPNANR